MSNGSPNQFLALGEVQWSRAPSGGYLVRWREWSGAHGGARFDREQYRASWDFADGVIARLHREWGSRMAVEEANA